MDTVDKAIRSMIMSKVGQKNTGPEMLLRSALHRSGLRYRLHDRTLPGSPDLVFPKHRAVLFVNGCFWHGHGCARSTIPKTRRKFWLKKFADNRARDERNAEVLVASGWRVLIIWECILIGKLAMPQNDLIAQVKRCLKGSESFRHQFLVSVMKNPKTSLSLKLKGLLKEGYGWAQKLRS